jgi:hypothetical protein
MSAAEPTQSQFEVTAFNPYGLAVEQSISHFLSYRNQNALEGRARDAHLLGSLFLFQAFQILQAQGLGLIDGQTDFFKHPHGDANWLEIIH